MTAFPQAVAAQMAGASVRIADLVRFGFASGEVRLWSGFSDFTDLNGEVWKGIGNLGAIGALEVGTGQAMSEMTFVLFGDVAMLAYLQSDAEQATGREVRTYQQFFDVRQFDENGNWVDWKPLDVPTQLFWGIMGPLTVDRPTQQVTAKEGRQRTITVRAANGFINRGKPPYAFYSNEDQLARSTNNNDNLCINSARMALTTVRWPKFS